MDNQQIAKINKEIESMVNNNNSPEFHLSQIDDEKKKLFAENEKIRKGKWFWQESQSISSKLLDEFSAQQLPLSLRDSEDTKRFLFEREESYLHRSLSDKNIEINHLKDWIKASEIVNYRQKTSLAGVQKGISTMDNEIKRLSTASKQKELQINTLEQKLVSAKKELNKVSDRSEKMIEQFNGEKVTTISKLEAIGSYEINSLPYRIKMAEIEAYEAKRDFILEQQKKENLLANLKTTEQEVEYLLLKYENDLTESNSKLAFSKKQIDEYQLALEDAVLRLSNAENDVDKWEKLYRIAVGELADLNVKHAEQTSLNNRIYSIFNNPYTAFSNFGKTFLLLVIIYYFLKIISKINSFFKWDVERNK